MGPALGEVPLPDFSQLPQQILILEAREEVRMSVKGRWQRQGSYTIQSQGLCDVLTIHGAPWCDCMPHGLGSISAPSLPGTPSLYHQFAR